MAFDAGGVTTGPMTVPFIMAMGVGISAIRSDRHAADDSFGLVALCSIGPVMAVLILGLLFEPQGALWAYGSRGGGGLRGAWMDVPEGVSGVYEGDCGCTFADHCIFRRFPGGFFADRKERAFAYHSRTRLYVRWSGTFPDGSECWIYAGRHAAWTDDCVTALPVGDCADWYGDRIFYRYGGARRSMC